MRPYVWSVNGEPNSFALWRAFSRQGGVEAIAAETARRLAALAPAERAGLFAVAPEPDKVEGALRPFREGGRPGAGVVPALAADVYDLPGYPTLAGSAFLLDVRRAAIEPAGLLEALRKRGFAVVGKTQLSAFGLAEPLAHAASVRAVEAGIAPLALAADLAGSAALAARTACVLRLPPMPSEGVFSSAPSYEAPAWVTATADDLHELTTEMLAIEAKGEITRLAAIEPELHAIFGDELIERDAETENWLRHQTARACTLLQRLAAAEAAARHAGWFGPMRQRYPDGVRAYLERGAGSNAGQLRLWENARERLRLALGAFFAGWDGILTSGAGPILAAASLAGLPVISRGGHHLLLGGRGKIPAALELSGLLQTQD